MYSMKTLYLTVLGVTVIGGLNWGIVGVSNFINKPFDLVTYLFTDLMGLADVTNFVYVLVGLAALCVAFLTMSKCGSCGVGDRETRM